MNMPRSVGQWLRLPSRIALILGMGALSATGARADAPESGPGATVSPAGRGDVLIRSEGGQIFLSEGGRETELRLTATPQRDHLLQLLEEHGAAGIKLDRDPRLIMSGGGGTGFSLWDTRKSITDKPAPAPPDPPQLTAPRSMPEKGSAPHDHNPATDKKG
jgi:hypothetical protein